MSRMNENLCRDITAQIIESLKNSVGPWTKPWECNGLPRNRTTHKPYRGINTLLLMLAAMKHNFGSAEWVTFHQAKHLGGAVKPGARGTSIVFFQCTEAPVMLVDERTGEIDETIEKRFLLRKYAVFNVEQTTLKSDETRKAFRPVQTAEDLLNEIPAVVKHGGDQAFYDVIGDIIQMPEKERFDSADGYYATRLHETIHWTGRTDRLGRISLTPFASQAYAKEELTAELGSTFLCGHLGIQHSARHAGAYIESWLKILKNDVRFIFKAANEAQKACDFILDYMPKAEKAG